MTDCVMMTSLGSFPGDSSESGPRRPIVAVPLAAYWEAHMNPFGHPRALVPIKERLDAQTMKTEVCWIWMGFKGKTGYGVMSYRNRRVMVHRIAWAVSHSDDSWFLRREDDKKILHRCDFPPCVNPDHLFVGTQRDNQRDCVKKGRHFHKEKTACCHGHSYTPSNTVMWKDGRHCRECLKVKRQKDNKSRRMGLVSW
jgi:hypothetical protein